MNKMALLSDPILEKHNDGRNRGAENSRRGNTVGTARGASLLLTVGGGVFIGIFTLALSRVEDHNERHYEAERGARQALYAELNQRDAEITDLANEDGFKVERIDMVGGTTAELVLRFADCEVTGVGATVVADDESGRGGVSDVTDYKFRDSAIIGRNFTVQNSGELPKTPIGDPCA